MISEPTAPVAAAAPPADAGGRAVLARRASVVSIAVLASRVLGVVREQIFAVFFGAGRELDAFITAFRIPNLLRDLFAEGALSAAFVSTFTQYLERGGEAAAWRLASLVISAGDRPSAEGFARRLAASAPRSEAVRVLGPVEAPLAVVRGRHRFRLLVKSPRGFDLSAYLRQWMAAVPKAKGTLKLEVDVDPQSFF